MACWRCVICFVFVALTLKSLLGHINTAHGRNPDFRVICGIDDCPEEYRVFNSFYYHIRRRHALYLVSGRPPTGWMTTASFEPSRIGGENFDIPVFSDCITETRGLRRTAPEVNSQINNDAIKSMNDTQEELEDSQSQSPDHQLQDFPMQHPGHQVSYDVMLAILHQITVPITLDMY